MYDIKVLPDMTGSRPDSTISLVQFDPVKEMEILRSVVLRDALVALLAEQRRKFMAGGDLCTKTVLRALLETRKASLEVIDAVERWRFTLIKPEEFAVRGQNYVATMATDMSFLATGLTPLKEAFGMDLGTGNPFALPCMTSPSQTATTTVRRTARAAANNVTVSETLQQSRTTYPAMGSTGTPGMGSQGAIRDTTTTTPRVKRNGNLPMVRAGVSNTGNNTAATPAASNSNSNNSAATIISVDNCGDGNDCGYRREENGAKATNSGAMTGEEVGGEKGHPEDGDELLEALFMLGDVDDEQRKRLAGAQRFLEAELARTGAKAKQASWWGFHRWTERPWVYASSSRKARAAPLKSATTTSSPSQLT